MQVFARLQEQPNFRRILIDMNRDDHQFDELRDMMHRMSYKAWKRISP